MTIQYEYASPTKVGKDKFSASAALSPSQNLSPLQVSPVVEVSPTQTSILPLLPVCGEQPATWTWDTYSNPTTPVTLGWELANGNLYSTPGPSTQVTASMTYGGSSGTLKTNVSGKWGSEFIGYPNMLYGESIFPSSEQTIPSTSIPYFVLPASVSGLVAAKVDTFLTADYTVNSASAGS